MKRLLVFVVALALPQVLSDVAMNQPVEITENQLMRFPTGASPPPLWLTTGY
jgi:hypothetical protein